MHNLLYPRIAGEKRAKRQHMKDLKRKRERARNDRLAAAIHEPQPSPYPLEEVFLHSVSSPASPIAKGKQEPRKLKIEVGSDAQERSPVLSSANFEPKSVWWSVPCLCGTDHIATVRRP